MNDPLRIGLMTPAWPGHKTANGITTAVYHLALGLQQIGHKPVILSDNIDGEMPQDIPLVEATIPAWSLMDRVRGKFSLSHATATSHRQHIGTLARIMQDAQKAHGIDIVIMEETFGWAADVIPLVDIPIVLCLHGPWLIHKHIQSWGEEGAEQDREKAEERAFMAAAGLLAPAQNVLAAIEEAYALPDRPRQVIANSYWAPPIAPNHRDGHILFVGRYDLHKGGDTVLKAFDDLARTHSQAQLCFAGPNRGVRHRDGQITKLEGDLEALAPEGQSRITYLGPQSTQEVAGLRQTHPIALMASRYEIFGYTMLEAMAAGQAIVSTAVGGPAEVLKDGETALLVPPDDPGAMANALRRLLDDPALAARLGQAARADVETRFHPETIAAETVAYCRKVLARQSQL